MHQKRNELPPSEFAIPLLEDIQREKIEFSIQSKKRFKRWYRAYMGTTLTALVLCFTVLIVGWGKDGISWLSADTVTRLGSYLVGLDFKDLSGIAPKAEEDEELPSILDGFLIPDPSEYEGGNTDGDSSGENPAKPSGGNSPSQTLSDLYRFDYSAVPEGETPIIPMDLSLTSYGVGYIYNTTGLTPDTEELLKRDFSSFLPLEYLSNSTQPLVLIVHTHGTEGYSEDGAISYLDDGGELARSSDPAQTVVSVGQTLAEALNQYGISTVHCSVMHDQEQYRNSYARAEETIRQYLERYPSIRLVIDVHRDSIIKSTGELVRPVTAVNGETAAQVMCVVGSNWGGEANPNWEGNLALALKLREELNASYQNLCRPPYLRSSTYNQELAPYSLLLEIGAAGNSLAEAQRSAKLVARVLATYIPQL